MNNTVTYHQKLKNKTLKKKIESNIYIVSFVCDAFSFLIFLVFKKVA